MAEPNEQGESQEPTEPVEGSEEPQESTEDEPETEEQGEQPEPSEEPEPPASAGQVVGMSEKELETQHKKVATAVSNYARRLSEIMGEEAQVLETCPRCAPTGFPGFIFPAAMAPLDQEAKAAVLVSIGEQPSEVTKKDNFSRLCEDCDGWGRVLSGSKLNAEKTLRCIPCGGRGWVPVGPERQSGSAPTALVAASNGPSETVEQPPDSDPWGRTPGDPDYGRLPQYTGVSQVVRVSFADLMLAGIFACLLYALLHGFGQMKGKGDKCGCCKKLPLRLVNGVLVCAACDCVNLWPSQR